jgi:hypothetical protein
MEKYLQLLYIEQLFFKFGHSGLVIPAFAELDLVECHSLGWCCYDSYCGTVIKEQLLWNC